jgi:hypothetical protein
MRYAATALATLAAGPVLAAEGWSFVNLAILPMLVLAVGMTMWWRLAERRGLVVAAVAS